MSATIRKRRLPSESPFNRQGRLNSPSSNAVQSTQSDPKNRAPNADVFAVRRQLASYLPYVDRSEALSCVPQDLPIKNEWISLETLRSWLRACNSYHENHCHAFNNTGRFASSKPHWLIDVHRHCIVNARPGDRYVALSYVWGKTESTHAEKANIMALQKANALQKDSVFLPRTIRDVIALVKVLGETFLWVDRLCIVQDDRVTKQLHLEQMASIYAGSYLTVIVAQGDNAEAGLRGIPGVTGKPRDYHLAAYPAELVSESDPQRVRQVMEHNSGLLMQTSWFSRAWTFQEYIFSRRKLIFHNDTVNWECHCTSQHERWPLTVDFTCNRPLPRTSGGFEASSWPDLHRYARLVAIYNDRALTFPEDVFDAFSGVIITLSRCFPDGFVCGLPEMFFDAVLLWQPWMPMKRRIPSRSDTKPRLPSWSWVGWQGSIQNESWRSGYNYIRRNPDEFRKDDIWEPTSWVTQSSIEWYCSTDLRSPRRKIVTSFQLYCGTATPEGDHHSQLPDGWTRDVCAETGKVFFKHKSVPDQEFWYPIPLRGPDVDPPSISNPTFLHCRTRRAFLRFGEIFEPESSLCPVANLIDSDGNWAGVLRLNFQPTIFQKDAISQEDAIGIPLIELSRGSVRDQSIEEAFFDEWNHPYRRRKTANEGLYEFYNVLWIASDGYISYRKALGRVVKDTWDRIGKEWIDVTLG